MNALKDKYRTTLAQHLLFKGFSAEEVALLQNPHNYVNYHPGATIITEGATDDALFILLEGAVELLKQAASDKQEICLGTLGQGEIFGEISFLNQSARSCTVKAKNNVTILKISPGFIKKKFLLSGKILSLLKENIALFLSTKLKNSNNQYVSAELTLINLLSERILFSRFLIFILITFWIGDVVNRLLVTKLGWVNITSVSFVWIYLFIIVIPIIIFISIQKLSWSDFGVGSKNLKKSITDSLIISLVLVSVMLGIAFFIIVLVQHRSFLSALNMQALQPVMLFYFFHCYIQEFIARGVAQTILKKIFSDSPVILPITVAALMFGFFHVFFGFIAVGITAASGILFGYIYERQGNLVGVSLVHFLLGITAFTLQLY